MECMSFYTHSLGKFLATVQTLLEIFVQRTLVVWHKNRIMYLRLWAWLSCICQPLLATPPLSPLHPSPLVTHSTSIFSALDFTTHFSTNNCENSTIWITTIFHTIQLLHAHSFLSVDRKYVHFTANFFSTTFAFDDEIVCLRWEEKNNTKHTHVHTHTLETCFEVILI